MLFPDKVRMVEIKKKDGLASITMIKICTVESMIELLSPIYKHTTRSVVLKLHEHLCKNGLKYPVYFIDRLYVHISVKGRGLATSLMTESEYKLKSMTSCVFLVCDTVNEEIPLIPFYEKRGYKRIPTGSRKYPLMYKQLK